MRMERCDAGCFRMKLPELRMGIAESNNVEKVGLEGRLYKGKMRETEAWEHQVCGQEGGY